MESLTVFFVTFVLFMAVWIIALLIGRAIQKKKLAKFKVFLKENLPDFDIESDRVLIAKQKSKQVKPDITLYLDEKKQEIIVFTDEKQTGITLHRYDFNNLVSVDSSNQIISRGLFPKTYSYEETITLEFTDGQHFHLSLENVTNKSGSDQGADVVRNLLAPWRERMTEIAQEETQELGQ